MTHGSLFSGIGGFDLAAEWMGWDNIFHCEINPFGRRILNYYWPSAISYHDILQTDFTIHRGRIDVLSGGFPCQPYSIAGKRKGNKDDRHLWPAMLMAIEAIQPGWVVGENVHGIINWSKGLVFEQVQSDLEAAGYEVFSIVLPACSINAPHRRDRTWFIAHSRSIGHRGLQSEFGSECEETLGVEGVGKEKVAAHSYSNGRIGGDGKDEVNTNEGRKYAFDDIESIDFRWRNFPTQSPTCDGDDGLPSELDGTTFSDWAERSIQAGGNAIVPPIAYEFFLTIENFQKVKQ